MLFIVIAHTMYTLRTSTQWHTDCHRMIFSDRQPFSRDFSLAGSGSAGFRSCFWFRARPPSGSGCVSLQLQHTTPYKLPPGSPSSTSLLLLLLFIGFYLQESSLIVVIYRIHSLTSPQFPCDMNDPSTEPSLPPRSSPRSRLSISEHRRSALAGLNSNMADSTMGESDPRSSSRTRASNGGSPILATTGDPHHHHRTPSLGELHQELEQEQEAQVV